ncbi:hypothetical protein [Nocardia brasiliensis]|uniref:hypothetical protein n=1 Tax=Nocardia brasiliensis TaxID=37326 RepID=UPI00366B8D1B
MRKPFPKTENGWRRIPLPPHAVESIVEGDRVFQLLRVSHLDELLLPSRKETLRNPNNFCPPWRAARGENVAWVTPRTFRKSAATEVDHAYGDPERAARQLVTPPRWPRRLHRHPETVPDNRDVLERWARSPKSAKV